MRTHYCGPVSAADLGKSGYETAAALDADRALLERMEAIRRKAGALIVTFP